MNRRTIHLIAIGAVASSTFIAAPARAEMTAREMLSNYELGNPQTRELIEYGFRMNENGVGWLNSYIVTVRKEKPAYCPPEKLAFTGTQLIDILRRASDEEHLLWDQPWGLALLTALQRTFPCPPQSN
jgi:hypothetical protein